MIFPFLLDMGKPSGVLVGNNGRCYLMQYSIALCYLPFIKISHGRVKLQPGGMMSPAAATRQARNLYLPYVLELLLAILPIILFAAISPGDAAVSWIYISHGDTSSYINTYFSGRQTISRALMLI